MKIGKKDNNTGKNNKNNNNKNNNNNNSKVFLPRRTVFHELAKGGSRCKSVPVCGPDNQSLSFKCLNRQKCL